MWGVHRSYTINYNIISGGKPSWVWTPCFESQCPGLRWWMRGFSKFTATRAMGKILLRKADELGSTGALTHQAGPFQGPVGLLTSASPGQSYGAPLQPQGCVHCSPMAALRGTGGTPGQTSSSKEMLKQGTKVNYCKIFWDSMLRCFEEGLSPSQIIFFF